jgi:hypothetical protein
MPDDSLNDRIHREIAQRSRRAHPALSPSHRSQRAERAEIVARAVEEERVEREARAVEETEGES